MASLRVGVVGCGRFGRLHIRVWQQLGGCEVVAIADLDQGLLGEVSGQLKIPRTYSDARALIADGELDLIDIVSDEETHGPFVLEALRKGRHVFVEKPLATSLVQAREIQAAAGDRSLVMVGNISRFSQPYVALKRAVADGRLGRLGLIRAKRHFSRAWFEHFGKRVHPVWESGIHDLDLILWFAGARCRSVYALENNLSGNRFPDLFTATLGFEGGLVATLTSAWLVPAGGPQNLVETLELDGTIDADLELAGDRGMANFRLAHDGLNVWTDHKVQHPELTLWPTGHDRIGGAIRAELEHFRDQVLKGQPSPVAPLADSVAALRIAEAILESGRSGRIVELKD